jgi:hypothetical protein
MEHIQKEITNTCGENGNKNNDWGKRFHYSTAIAVKDRREPGLWIVIDHKDVKIFSNKPIKETKSKHFTIKWFLNSQ